MAPTREASPFSRRAWLRVAAAIAGATAVFAAAGPTAGVAQEISGVDRRERATPPAARNETPQAVPSRPETRPPLPGTILHSYPLDLAFPYGVIFDSATGDLWIGDLGGDFHGDGLVHRVRTDGTITGDAIDGRNTGITPVDGAFDPDTGMLWQLSGVYGIGCVNELDPAALIPTGRTICPRFWVQEMALAYDAATELFYAGSLDDTFIVRFDKSGTILDAFDGFPSISGLAFNPATRHLFVLHRAEDEINGSNVLVLDPAAGFQILTSFFVGNGEWTFEMRGVELDCDGHLWLVSQAGDAPTLLEVLSGEESDCAAARATLPRSDARRR
jgi:hypothetical protein